MKLFDTLPIEVWGLCVYLEPEQEMMLLDLGDWVKKSHAASD
jgi:hypothetical protein